jgi:hypothetical protein
MATADNGRGGLGMELAAKCWETSEVRERPGVSLGLAEKRETPSWPSKNDPLSWDPRQRTALSYGAVGAGCWGQGRGRGRWLQTRAVIELHFVETEQ